MPLIVCSFLKQKHNAAMKEASPNLVARHKHGSFMQPYSKHKCKHVTSYENRSMVPSCGATQQKNVYM
jgi:hypothetical protein